MVTIKYIRECRRCDAVFETYDKNDGQCPNCGEFVWVDDVDEVMVQEGT